MGVKIGGNDITDLRYADDITLISDFIENMRQILIKIAMIQAGLHLTVKKTNVMTVCIKNYSNIMIYSIKYPNIYGQ